MATNFPGSLDTFTDPIATNPTNSPSHATIHTHVNDAVAAIETVLLRLLAPQSSAVGSGTSTSATFAALSSTSSTVTITTGTNALVLLQAKLSNATLNDIAQLGIAVSGATTIAASATYAIQQQSAVATDSIQVGIALLYGPATGPGALTVGSNTFTAQLAAASGAGTASASNVLLTVIPLN